MDSCDEHRNDERFIFPRFPKLCFVYFASMNLRLDNHTARHVILHLQGMTKPPHLAMDTDGLASLIRQLGFVQLDAIPWVERAHHMTLFARNQTYRTKHLRRLHEKERLLFENWTHDASLIPSEFWPYWKHKFRREEMRLRDRFIRWQGEGFVDQLKALHTRVEDGGCIRSRDLEKPKGVKLGMWEWHSGKAALEYLWRTGQLAVPRREGFQKTYDLCERVIHKDHYDKQVSEETFVDWACKSALDRLGFGTAGDIARFWNLVSIDEVKTWLEGQGKNGVATVEVEGWKGNLTKEFIGRPDLEDLTKNLPKVPDRLRMLSPFDPVIRDRKRLKWLFGFDYTIEIYVPSEKRKYGYYVFPLLERDKLIGRVDAQAKRGEDVLTVSKVWLEPGVKWSAARDKKFAAELTRQTRLCEVKTIDWDTARIVK